MLNEIVDAIDRALPREFKAATKRLLPGVDRRFYRFVQRFSSSAASTVRIKKGILQGRLFRCSLKYERDYWLGLHEVMLMDFVAQHLHPGDVVYDIGAHKGYFTLTAASCVGSTGRVLAFEPNPTNYADTIHNVGLNADLASQIQVLPLAVADRSGSERFVGGADATVGHLVRDTAPDQEAIEETYAVVTTSLDELVESGYPPPALIKMDIEGAEKWALLGVRDLLRKYRPRLLVEVHDRESAECLSRVSEEVNYTLRTLADRAIPSGQLFERRDYVVALPRGDGSTRG